MQRACGTGGTVKNGQIERQARGGRPHPDEANFHLVFAGG